MKSFDPSIFALYFAVPVFLLLPFYIRVGHHFLAYVAMFFVVLSFVSAIATFRKATYKLLLGLLVVIDILLFYSTLFGATWNG